MLDRLAAQVAVGLEQLDQLLDTYRPLVEGCRETTPDAIELAALAAMLHSFYNGVENLLKRIVVETGESLPEGDLWHRRLLDQVSRPAEHRPGAISEALKDRLRLYLDFRHVFRHSYTFDLRWEKMRELVLDCDETLTALHQDLEAFLREVT